jgi:N-acyl-D-aspartate/D-glutamate deacylase
MSLRVSATAMAPGLLLLVACAVEPTIHDLVLLNGRVMNPETGLDAVANVGISGGQIAAVTADPLTGKERVDVRGLVVAPGFIDLHAHGQDLRSSQLQAQDGVTTALELEEGVFPLDPWYAARQGKALINYGASVGHIPARAELEREAEGETDAGARHYVETAGGQEMWANSELSAAGTDRLLDLLDQGLSEGGLGIGIGTEYTPGASREEVYRVFELASLHGVTLFAHVRYSGVSEPKSATGAMQEVIANAAVTGASLHIVHVTSMGLGQTPVILEMIDRAQERGLDITTEVYPYTAWSTDIRAAFFAPGWQEYLGMGYEDLQWVATGERLTKESFEKYRRQGGLVIGHNIPRPAVDLAVAHPRVMIASDGIPFTTGGEHPRGAGTYARVLGRYVRDKGALTLMDALRKMTLMPAQRLASYVPQMRRKGRLAAGMDADITIFDPERVLDRATFEEPMQASDGIVHVLVGGTFVVRDSRLVPDTFPGRAIRRSSS